VTNGFMRKIDEHISPFKHVISPDADPRKSHSLEYGLAILECFSFERQSLEIAEIADLVGMSRSTTHRYAITLVALGYLEQDPQRKYRLSTSAVGPGEIGVIRREVPARVALEELREETGYTVSMGVLDGGRVVYLHRLFGHRRQRYEVDRDLGVDANVPLHCTALGKVLLANLSEAKRSELLATLALEPEGPRSITEHRVLVRELERIGPREVVVSDEEFVRGARSIAVLVPRWRSERPLAVEITVPSSVYTVDQLVKTLGPRLKRTARVISEE
jgi:IclR family transcriptional regulator, pca regulon regulatory protein